MQTPQALMLKRERGRRYRQTLKGKANARERQRRYRERHPERTSARYMQGNLRRALIDREITETDYQAMLIKQHGTCAICSKPTGKRRLDIDHDHDTGKVRGLLCLNCNRAIGLFNEDPHRLVSAIEYLTDANP
jgi:hypothetical protein